MKKIDAIIIHCSATRAGQDIKAKDIDRMHRARGFNQIGYNYVIDLDGIVETGRPLTIAGAHCIGYNDHSVGICYVGGLDASGQPTDTRTLAQKTAMNELINDICQVYDIVELLGHRDTSRDLNDNGIVEPFEWIKSCPCFDVREEYKAFLKPNNCPTMRYLLYICITLCLVGCRTRIKYVPIESKADSIYIDRLIPYPLPADSASIRALMECDENGKVVLQWLDMSNTKNVQLMFTIDSLGNVISNMVVPRDTIYLPSKEVYVDRKIEVPILVEKELSRWEKMKIEVGGWAIGVLSGLALLGIGYAVYWLIRRKK